MFRKYGWSRAYFLTIPDVNRCSQGFQNVRQGFIAAELVIAEWTEVNETAINDAVLNRHLDNMKERARGNDQRACTG